MDGLSSLEIPQITVDSEPEQTSCSISRGNIKSRSVENLLDIQSTATTTTLSLSADHRHCSVPEALDTVGKKPNDVDNQSLNLKEDGQRFLSAVAIRPASQKRKKQQTLVPPSRKEMHYDYVRRSIIHQCLRMNSLRRQTKSTSDVSKVTSLDEFDSDDGGYVIEYQEEEEEEEQLIPSPTLDQEQGASSSYVQLQSSPAGSTGKESESEAHTSQSSDEADSIEQISPPCSPKPPLFLHEHPSLIGAKVADSSANDEGDYENIVIYEELGVAASEDDSEHHYDTVLQMRGRVTQMVRGKQRKKLKKFIVKRKSSVQLVTGDPDPKTQDSKASAAVEDSDSDSSDEDDSKSIQQARLEPSGRRSPGTLRRAKTYHDGRSKYRKERESKGDAILRKSQYDKMMEAMLNDHEMKELQDAGAVKVKNLAEMRAEIEELVRNAPPVPPPLPDNDRPKTPLNSKKKWSSQSLRH